MQVTTIVLAAFVVAVAAVDPDPTSIRTAIDTLEPQVKSQAGDIRQLKNSLLAKGTITDGAQLQSALQRVNAALNNGASNETVFALQKDALDLFGSVNNALAATSSVGQIMQDALDTAMFAEEQSINIIDEAATSKIQIDDARNRLTDLSRDLDERADAFPEKADVFDEVEASLAALEAEIDDMLGDVAEFPEVPASRLAAMYENNAGFKGSNSKPIYRYGYFDTYGPQGGWTFGNDGNFFGDVAASSWSGNYRAYQMSTDFDSFRAVATDTGFVGPQGSVFVDDKYYYSSSDMNRMLILIFRIRNKSSSTVSHNFRWYYSVYGGWNDRTSMSLNDNSNWESSSTCSQCSESYTLSFPGNKISTVVWAVSASPRQSGRRGTILQFYNNCLRLDSNLEFIDDLDSATAWIQ